MVTEDYVSFEIAKLLKEKEFDWCTYAYYEDEDNPNISLRASKAINWNKNRTYLEAYSKPTIQMAMKWLREVHNIFVCIVLLEDIDGYGFTVENTVNKKYIATSKNDGYSTYEQSCEEAIKYCLKNLI